MDTIKLTNTWKEQKETKWIYDLLTKPICLGGLDIENVNVTKISTIKADGDSINAILNCQKDDTIFTINLYGVDEVYNKESSYSNVLLSIENGSNKLVLLIKEQETLMHIQFKSGSFKLDNNSVFFE